jgi:hypothetical protein
VSRRVLISPTDQAKQISKRSQDYRGCNRELGALFGEDRMAPRVGRGLLRHHPPPQVIEKCSLAHCSGAQMRDHADNKRPRDLAWPSFT